MTDWSWLTDPTTWEMVADAISNDHEYDFDDTSERLDAVQIVCEALAKVMAREPD